MKSNTNQKSLYALQSLPSRGAWIEILGAPGNRIYPPPSLPSRGAWIEIDGTPIQSPVISCRSPHGERGLKLNFKVVKFAIFAWSLPSRGAWIEIQIPVFSPIFITRRSPHGERGLKYFREHLGNGYTRRSPHGERGLKFLYKKVME